MQSVGQKLRLARQSQERTLEQVNSTTRISLKNLDAIEADDLTAISSAFLYRSFVRQFAQDLKLDFAELEPMIQDASSRIPDPRIPGQGLSAVPRVAALPIGRKRNSRLLHSISLFALMLVVCSAVYAFWQNAKFSPTALQKAAKARFADASTPAAKPAFHPALAPEKIQANTGGVQNPEAASSSDPSDKFKLELSATEPAWLSIVADGKPSFKGILARAETKVLEGYRSARIRTGNAGGVEVVFNGKPLGALGPRGQVRTVLFTQNNYEVLKAPVHISLLSFSQIAGPEQPMQPLELPGS